MILTFGETFGDFNKGDVLKYGVSISNPKHWGVTLEVTGRRSDRHRSKRPASPGE